MAANTPIITVTLNPAVDQTVFLDALCPGEVNRSGRSQRQAGGKGVNVGTMLSMGGAEVVVAGFLGEANAGIFERHFEKHGMADAFVRVAGETRTGIKILDTKYGTTDVNLSGADPTAAQCEDLYERLMGLAEIGRWFVLSGSLPVGVAPDYFSRLIVGLRERGAKVAVDSSGPALSAAVEVGVDLIKPNEHELAELLGQGFSDVESVVSSVREALQGLVSHVIVSMGEDGAVFLTPDSELLARAPSVQVVSTVGAGDSLLAGYLQGVQRGLSPADCARLATVYAWCNLESLETQLPCAAVVEARMAEIEVSELNSKC